MSDDSTTHQPVDADSPQSGASACSRRRGAIVLDADLCTSCMICVRECPVWCIELVADKVHDPSAGPRGKSTLVLTDFRIDFGLCMDCGICVDVCPTDALSWVPTSVPATSAAGELDASMLGGETPADS